MTLLREVMERPLDPAYAAAAARRAAGGGRSPGRSATAFTLLLAVLAGAAFAVSVTSIRQPQRESTEANNQLRAELRRRTAAVNTEEAGNAVLREANTMAQRSALGASGADLAARIQLLGVATGELAISGPGLRFTVDDAPGQSAGDTAVGGDPRADSGYDEGRVLDSDLQTIVNGLWAAGAEGIAINGHRLTALSAIRTAGQAILVDFRPLSRPYRIDAIGAAGPMQTGFASGPAGPYVQSMRDNSGIRVDVSTQDSLALPGSGQLVLREAVPVPSQPAAKQAAKPANNEKTKKTVEATP